MGGGIPIVGCIIVRIWELNLNLLTENALALDNINNKKKIRLLYVTTKLFCVELCWVELS